MTDVCLPRPPSRPFSLFSSGRSASCCKPFYPAYRSYPSVPLSCLCSRFIWPSVLVEGLATAAVVIFVWKARPEMIQPAPRRCRVGNRSFRKVLIGLLVATVITGGVLSWFASTRPDGLEWSIFKTTGTEEVDGSCKRIHTSLGKVQEKTALLPDYNFKNPAANPPVETSDSWPVADGGTTVAGLVGGAITLILAVSIGFALKRRKR